MNNENTKFNFWEMYEKFVSPLPESIVENKDSDMLKKAIMQGGMADVSFHTVILPFTNRQKQEISLRNMIEAMICFDKFEDFDHDKYYHQFLEKQNKENKELPLTDFVDMLINDKKIPSMNYKEYEEQVLNKRISTENNIELEKSTKSTMKIK